MAIKVTVTLRGGPDGDDIMVSQRFTLAEIGLTPKDARKHDGEFIEDAVRDAVLDTVVSYEWATVK